MDPEAVHKLAGAIVLVATALLLAREAGLLPQRAAGFVLPAGIVGMGLFLVLDPIVFHGGEFGAEGRQHQLQGGVAIAVGLVETVRALGRLQDRVSAALLPLAIIVVGLLFVLHSQHGGGDMAFQLVQHRILGATLILAGLVLGANRLKAARGNWASVGWLLILLVVCIELFFYAEGGGGRAAAHSGH